MPEPDKIAMSQEAFQELVRNLKADLQKLQADRLREFMRLLDQDDEGGDVSP
jgi:hypothetical protein